jgi:hypothetical protein
MRVHWKLGRSIEYAVGHTGREPAGAREPGAGGVRAPAESGLPGPRGGRGRKADSATAAGDRRPGRGAAGGEPENGARVPEAPAGSGGITEEAPTTPNLNTTRYADRHLSCYRKKNTTCILVKCDLSAANLLEVGSRRQTRKDAQESFHTSCDGCNSMGFLRTPKALSTGSDLFKFLKGMSPDGDVIPAPRPGDNR